MPRPQTAKGGDGKRKFTTTPITTFFQPPPKRGRPCALPYKKAEGGLLPSLLLRWKATRRNRIVRNESDSDEDEPDSDEGGDANMRVGMRARRSAGP